jgi:drug/metabolite transporter (DMT)-like permease
MSITAFLLVILAAFLHASWNFIAKKTSGNLSVIYIGLLISCIFIFPFFILYFSFNHFFYAFLYILATGILHAIYFFFLCKAYKHGDISVVYPIARGCGIAGTALIAYLFSMETLSSLGVAGIICVSIGTILAGLKISHQKNPLKGIMYALIVGLTIAGYSVVDKTAVSTINPVVYIYSMAFGTSFFLTPLILFGKRQELIHAWKELKQYSFIIGLGSMGTYLIILFAFQMANVSYVVATRELSVAIGAFLGIKILKEPYSLKKIMGIICIILGMIIIKIVTL